MFFQLGTRQYSGLKSFISFDEESEAVVVEYALIGRKPRLQGTANSLTSINISLFFHQSFCNVKEEIDALKKSKSDYEILPLLAGSGEFYGDFVITSLSISRSQMDDYGNTTAAEVTISLKENIKEDKQQQLQQNATQNATATGNKKPVTKSSRQNPPTCNKTVSLYYQTIRSNYAPVKDWVNKYAPGANPSQCIVHLKVIDSHAKRLSANLFTYDCISGRDNLQIQDTCSKISSYAQQLWLIISTNGPDTAAMQSKNWSLDAAVNALNGLTYTNQIQAGVGK